MKQSYGYEKFSHFVKFFIYALPDFHYVHEAHRFKWDYIFKNGQRKISRRLPLKKLELVYLKRPYHLILLKDSPPQISLGPVLNTLIQIALS